MVNLLVLCVSLPRRCTYKHHPTIHVANKGLILFSGKDTDQTGLHCGRTTARSLGWLSHLMGNLRIQSPRTRSSTTCSEKRKTTIVLACLLNYPKCVLHGSTSCIPAPKGPGGAEGLVLGVWFLLLFTLCNILFETYSCEAF